MKTSRTERAAEKTKSDYLPIRIRPVEKASFQVCADLAGVSLSSWIRERLRMAAIRELESAGRRIPFVEAVPIGGPDE